MSVRRAEASDAPKIAQLARAAHLHSRNLKWVDFFVAIAAGEIIGCCRVRRRPGGFHELSTLAVAKAWRSRGVTRVLAAVVLAQAPRPLFGICLAAMVPLYQHFGGRAAERAPWRLRCECALVNAVLRLRRRADRAVIMMLA